MQVSFTLFFFLMGIVLSGILLGSFTYIQDESSSQNRGSKYWLLSLVSTTLGYFVFSVAIGTAPNAIKAHSFIFTVANVLYVGGLVFQVLFCHTLRYNNPKSIWFAWAFLILFAMEYEYARGAGYFSLRVIQVALISLVCQVWQIIDLWLFTRRNQSIQLRLLAACTVFEALLVIARALLASKTGNVETLEQIPVSLLVVTFGFSAFNVVSYLIAAGYWAEQNVAKRTEARIENEKVKALLHERDALVGSLLKANKNSTTAAISASIAHELNQPIAAIDVNMFMLERALEASPVDTQKVEALMASIGADNQRAANIIRSIGSIFKNNAAPHQTIAVGDLLASVMRIAGPDCKAKGIELIAEAGVDANLYIDSTAVQQVFLNLIANSVAALQQARAPSGKIQISASCIGHGVRFSVLDNGPGIPAQYQSRIFELMQSNKEGGSGLGLWLCKHIITEHGGAIWFENQQDSGVQFNFELPYSTPIVSP